MEDNSEYRIDEPIKAHGIIIGAMILTLLLVLGFDSLIDWWFRVKGDLPSIVYDKHRRYSYARLARD